MDGFIEGLINVFAWIFKQIWWLVMQILGFCKWVLRHIYQYGFMTIYYTVRKWTEKKYHKELKPRLQKHGIIQPDEQKVYTPTTEPKE